jgi:hypothetical protein
MSTGWIGVDLDGTLAEYHGWQGPTIIGDPVPAMLERVKGWLAEGQQVRIFTARVSCKYNPDHSIVCEAIHNWCKRHIGQKLTLTASKDFDMIVLYDDRVVQVERNTGRLVGENDVT